MRQRVLFAMLLGLAFLLAAGSASHAADVKPIRSVQEASDRTQERVRTSAPVSRTKAIAWDYGCAEDAYPPSERVARQVKLRMPIPGQELLGVLPEPAVIHSDLDGSKSGQLLECAAFGAGHLCYNGHEGTDFSLGGSFLQMGTVRAAAAATGVVIKVRADQFDRCHVNPNPMALIDGSNETNVICPDPDHPESVALTAANKVSLCHPDGTVTEYLHLMRGSVPRHFKDGTTVACGEVVGTIGSSGKSSGPHLHLSVLVPASRAQAAGSATGKPATIGGRDYVYVDPYSTNAGKDLWTSQTWNYAASFDNSIAVPALAHPNGHPTTLPCAHPVQPHSGHPGTVPCTHPKHDGDPIMVPCTHFLHLPHGLQPCTHVEHPDGHHQKIAGVKQYTPCVHGPKHPDGDPTTLPCTHPPVPQHAGGDPGPNVPCTHVGFETVSISAFTLPGPQCDGL